MATIEFENGKKVEFDGDPTPEDVDFVAKELGIGRGGMSPENKARLRTEAQEAEQESQKGIGRRFLGELPKQTAKELLQKPAKLAISGALAPIDIARQTAGGKPISTELPFVGKTFQAEAEERLEKGASPLGTVGRAALEVPLAGAEALGVGKAAGALRNKRLASQAIKKTAPVLNKAQEQIAKQAGRVYKSFFGKVKLTPSPRDIETAKTVEKLITSGDPFKNIERVRTAIAKTDNTIQQGIKKNNVPVYKNRLRIALLQAKEESRVVFGSDKMLESAYDSVVDEMMRQADKADDLSKLFQARKNFDSVIKQKFPKLFSNLTSDAPRTNAVLDVRRAANDFIANHLPKDSIFRTLLHKENLMFEAIRNIAARSPKIGTSAVGRFLKKPLVRYGAGAIGAGTAFEAGRQLFPSSE